MVSFWDAENQWFGKLFSISAEWSTNVWTAIPCDSETRLPLEHEQLNKMWNQQHPPSKKHKTEEQFSKHKSHLLYLPAPPACLKRKTHVSCHRKTYCGDSQMQMRGRRDQDLEDPPLQVQAATLLRVWGGCTTMASCGRRAAMVGISLWWCSGRGIWLVKCWASWDGGRRWGRGESGQLEWGDLTHNFRSWLAPDVKVRQF